MATLENVKLLEEKIAQAVDKVKILADANMRLSEENKQLKTRADKLQNQVNELEFSVLAFKEDQENIETGISSLLKRLNQIEDSVDGKDTESSETAPQAQTQQSAAPQTDYNRGEMFPNNEAYKGNDAYYPS